MLQALFSKAVLPEPRLAKSFSRPAGELDVPPPILPTDQLPSIAQSRANGPQG